MRRKLLIVLGCAVLAGCGGGGADSGQPVENVRETVREEVREAASPTAADFPAPAGRTLQELADEIGGAGPRVGLATQTFVVGESRVGFGVIGDDGRFLYGPTAVYVSRDPAEEALGPFLAPADVLVTDPAFRSKQAATEGDLFAAVYAADVRFPKAGTYFVLTATKAPDGTIRTAGTEVKVVRPSADPVPGVGDPAPKVETDTLESLGGDEELLDTRTPPSDMHANFADVAGSKPVALLFATPALCQSRVCGPVVDIALQLEERYGDRIEFIHQEVYEGNDLQRGLREPLRKFNLKTEPWLFVVGADGRITARLEGSFGLKAFEKALETAL